MIQAVQQRQLVGTLQQQLACLEGRQRAAWGTVSSGCAALDRLLPHRGLPRGSIVEWLAPASGCGAATLAVIAAVQACRTGGALVVVDRRGGFFPPAAVALGIDPARMIVVRPRDEADEHWALDQALRNSAVAAVWAEVARLDARGSRRFQLAAEGSGALGLFVRPAAVQGEPSWAELQLLVRPLAAARQSSVAAARQRRLQVELVRCRGGTGGGRIELQLDEATAMLRERNDDATTPALSLAAPLADPAPHRCATGC